MGGCRNYDPFLGAPDIRCRIKIRIQKGILILTITHTQKVQYPLIREYTLNYISDP